MAFEAVMDVYSAPAAVDLSAKQFYAVSYDTNGNINLANAGKNMDGILQDKPLVNMAGSFAFDGFTKAAITAGVAVPIGTLLQVDTTGTLTTFSTGTAVAKAVTAVGAGGVSVAIIGVKILRSNAGF